MSQMKKQNIIFHLIQAHMALMRATAFHNEKLELELLKLHIHRKQDIKRIGVERELGALDIYIPANWDMETYPNQEKLRKVMSAEVKWQALNIL